MSVAIFFCLFSKFVLVKPDLCRVITKRMKKKAKSSVLIVTKFRFTYIYRNDSREGNNTDKKKQIK